MARIRTIKPDFWTDEKLTECSLSARLLFIGMLNFADDNGNLTASAKKLKMQIFPADNVECQPLLDELIAQGVVIEYSVSGDNYLNIKGFKKHQVINRPSNTNIPEPLITEDSLSTPVVITDGREGKGREVKALSGKPDFASAEKSEAGQAIEYLNEKTNSGYKHVESNLRLVKARFSEGFTLDEVKAVIDRQVGKWGGDSKMEDYLRPKTLFAASNFASYAGQATPRNNGWWSRAGFDSAFDAENHGCNQHNAHQWQDRKRQEVTA